MLLECICLASIARWTAGTEGAILAGDKLTGTHRGRERAGEPTQPMGRTEPVLLFGSPVAESCLRPSWLTELVSVVETVCPNICARLPSV